MGLVNLSMASAKLSVKLLMQGPSKEVLYGKQVTWRNKGVEITHVMQDVKEEVSDAGTKYYGVVPMTSSTEDGDTFLNFLSMLFSLDRKFLRVINELRRSENPEYDEETNSLVYKYCAK